MQQTRTMVSTESIQVVSETDKNSIGLSRKLPGKKVSNLNPQFMTSIAPTMASSVNVSGIGIANLPNQV